MKQKFIKLVCLALCLMLCENVMAQQTSLTIDNQSPGWLSSKIGYGDQQTVENLKVTGYINNEDLRFISSLILNHSLHGKLELEESYIVGDSPDKDNHLINDANIFGNGGESLAVRDTLRLKYFSYPKSLVSGETRAMNRLSIDTLFINTSTGFTGALFAKVNHIRIGENVSTLIYPSINDIALHTITSIEFPSTLKEIRETWNSSTSYNTIQCKIKDGTKLKIFPNLERLVANFSIESMPDSVYFPKIKVLSLDQYYNYSSNKMFKKGMHVFIGKDIKLLTDMSDAYGIHLHFSNANPPKLEGSITYHYQLENDKRYILHVPKGSADAYRACFKDGGTKVTIIEETIDVTEITLSYNKKELKVGQTFPLSFSISPDDATDQLVSWSSDNIDIVTVSSSGLLTAKKAGECVITAKSLSNPNVKATCDVTVIQPVTGITLSESTYTLKAIGESVQLKATVLPEDASNKKVNWSCPNNTVCVVSNGNVVAVGYGVAVVIAMTEDGGFMSYCTVTVEDTTGITDVKEENNDCYPTYDAMGRKVHELKKGQLYIREGKKFIVR